MIPKINLDDRTFDDIFNDALRLIPRYCPEWTNHNTSDPGITLLELFSWMTEMTIYRLNKVPEKTYLSLLELMGLSLITPQSARTVVQFFPVEGLKRNIEIKTGTQIAAVVSDAEDIIFETEKKIKVNNTKLISCVNKYKENWTENVNQINNNIDEFVLFESKNEVEHAIYIASDSFKYLEFEHYIQLSIEPIQDIVSESDAIVKHMFWEYWDGTKWSNFKTSYSINNLRKKDNVIYLHGNVPLQTCEINGKENLWIRGILSDIPSNLNALSAKSIKLRTIFGGKGFSPDNCLLSSNSLYAPVDMNTPFRMFSESPSYNEAFYISADEILQNKKINVSISYTFSETYVNEDVNNNAVFVYEYWDGSDWVKLSQDDNFIDGTFNFKQSGVVSFVIPEKFSITSVDNEEHYWLRVRLITKDFATGGEYVKDDKDNWIWHFTTKVQTPIIEKIRIKYESLVLPPKECCSYSNFHWKILKDFTKLKSNKEITFFEIDTNNMPSLYLGFDNKFPDGEYSIYFRMNEVVGHIQKNIFENFNNDKLFNIKSNRSVSLIWEYYNGTEWKRMTVNDNTDSFHQSGFIDFVTPEDIEKADNFNKELYWIRVSLLSGSFENQPIIKNILLNCVYVKNDRTYHDEILGSGTGAPGQSVKVAHSNILKGSVLYVNEGSKPSENELLMIEEDVKDNPHYEDKNGYWVRYKEVENFYSSNAFSRHYVIDYSTGVIKFGDGTKGVNPPKGKFNILMKSYHTGGGTIGNVAKNTIQGLVQGIPFISGCTNPYPAEGGADMESVENIKSRAAGTFKSLQRAVTSEDFQWIAREASSSVGRSYCLKNRNSKNEVCTVIIPVRPSGVTYETKLTPSRELIRRVKEYLDERKLVGTPICVQGPVYKEFNISLALMFKSDVIDDGRLKSKIERILRIYFDSLEGDEGNGWEFGKEVTTGSILKQLEKINEILSISSVEIFDLDANVVVEKILLKEDELPFLNKVIIEKR